MKVLTTIFLLNTLRATLDEVEHLPDVDQNYPGVLKFKQTLSIQIRKLGSERPPEYGTE